MQRRLILLTALALVAGAAQLTAAEPQLAHMVFFTLAEDNKANRETLVAACTKYLKGHEGAVYYSAGAIADAGAVANVLHMGAAGAWVGTRFVASDESLAHDIYKQRLVDAGPDDTRHGKFYSFGWGIGAPYRIVPPKSRWTPRGLIAGGPRRADSGAWARGIKAYAGQGVGCIDSILPAGKIVEILSARL